MSLSRVKLFCVGSFHSVRSVVVGEGAKCLRVAGSQNLKVRYDLRVFSRFFVVQLLGQFRFILVLILLSSRYV